MNKLVLYTIALLCNPIILSDLSASVTPLQLAISFRTTNPTCLYGTDGTISYTIINGEDPYTVALISGGAVVETKTQDACAGTFTGLTASSFYISVIDGTGSTALSYPIMLTNQQNPLAITNLTTQEASCPGQCGSVSFSITGGNQPYDARLCNPQFSKSLKVPDSSTQTVAAPAGTYTLKVRDSSKPRCKTAAMVTIAQAIKRASKADAKKQKASDKNKQKN